MLSAFNRPRSSKGAGSKASADETYDLRGLAVTNPDMVVDPHQSPFLLNCRMYAKDPDDKRVAMRTRKGSIRLSTPVGETLDTQNVATLTGDAIFSVTDWLAEPFVPTTSGALTKMEYEIKSVVSSVGHVIIEIFDDASGKPGTLLAQSSIYSSDITNSYNYIKAYFIDAPYLTSGVTYWHRVRVAPGGTATYALRKTAAAGGQTTVTPGSVYNPVGYTWRYKTYLSTPGEIIGFTRRYPQNANNRTIFAMGTGLYSVTDLGNVTQIGTGINASAKKVRFAQANDKTFIVDGFTSTWWDGTGSPTTIDNAPSGADNVIIANNRAFFMLPTGKIIFSDLYNFTSYPSVNFFYVDEPSNPDRPVAWIFFQNALRIFTHETKYSLYGTDLSSFQNQPAIGTKGAVSQEAMAADRNYVYFMADDKQIYRWNSADDELLSEAIEPILNSIQDVSKVRFHLYRNQLRVYYPATAGAKTEDMLLLELNPRDKNKYLQWFHDTGRVVGGSLEWKLDNNELIEFSSKVGAFYLGETGESDLGKIIKFRYWTMYKAYLSGSSKDRIKRFRPYVRPAETPYVLRVGKDIDFKDKPMMSDFPVDEGGAKWGTFVWGDGTLWGGGTQLIDEKVAMSGRGKHTQYRFESDALAAPVSLYGYMALIKSGRIR